MIRALKGVRNIRDPRTAVAWSCDGSMVWRCRVASVLHFCEGWSGAAQSSQRTPALATVNDLCSVLPAGRRAYSGGGDCAAGEWSGAAEHRLHPRAGHGWIRAGAQTSAPVFSATPATQTPHAGRWGAPSISFPTKVRPDDSWQGCSKRGGWWLRSGVGLHAGLQHGGGQSVQDEMAHSHATHPPLNAGAHVRSQ